MVVELYGMPGAGKSTIRDRLIARGVEVRKFRLPPLEGPRLVRSVRFRWAHRRGEGRRSWPGLLRIRAQQDQVGGDVVLEEGIVYHVWRSLFLTPSLRASKPWRDLLTDRYPLIVLKVPVEVRRERITLKPVPGPANRRMLRAPADSAVSRDAHELFEEVLQAAAATRPVVMLDATESPDRLADQVLDVLRQPPLGPDDLRR